MPDPYDVLTIAAIADELNVTIGNGRIQRIGLVDPRTIGAEVYAGHQRHYLLASADDRLPRLRLTSDMPSLDPALVTPFGLLLRKFVRGGILLGIDQPPLERLVRFSIAKRFAPPATRDAAPDRGSHHPEEEDEDELGATDDAEIRHVSLFVELMGRHSNLILVDNDGLIMESAKRVSRDMSRVRQVLPRLPYTPPPAQDRGDPRAVTPHAISLFLAELPAGGDLARALVGAFRGMSPQIAREIVYRLTGEAEAAAGDVAPEKAGALARETQALFEPLRTARWNPRIYRTREDDGGGDIVACSALPMDHLAAKYEEVPVESISGSVAAVEGSGDRPALERHAQRRRRLLEAVAVARERAVRRLASLADELQRASEAERLRSRGELIYANLWQISPGQTELAVDDVTVPLDPDLTASENAQAYFERYRKAQSATAHLPALEAEGRAEIAYLDQLATLIAQAPGFNELEALAAEWAELSESAPNSRPKRKTAIRRPRALVDAEGNSVYVGRSGPQNDLLTFGLAGPDDTWLHARGVGGSHVIIRWRTPGGEENPETVAAAAALAAWYSAARDSGAVEVDVTRRRYVRKIKGARPGMVTYRNERTIRVQPATEASVRDVLRES